MKHDMVRIGCSGWNYDAWRGQLYPETPDDFCFSLKASRYLTHVKRLTDHPDKGFALSDGVATTGG